MIKINELSQIILKSGESVDVSVQNYMGDRGADSSITAQCNFCNCGSNCNRCHK